MPIQSVLFRMHGGLGDSSVVLEDSDLTGNDAAIAILAISHRGLTFLLSFCILPQAIC